MNKHQKLANRLAALPEGVVIDRSEQHDHSVELFVSWDEPCSVDTECPYCGRSYCVKKDSGAMQTVRHVNSGVYGTLITFHKPRFLCKKCGRTFYVKPEWVVSDICITHASVRSIVENQTSDEPSRLPDICPVNMPVEVRRIIREEYDKYDRSILRSEELLERIRDKALSMEWETASSSISGADMLRIITSAPQIGDITAITWLAHIITPRRFPSAKALSAYCGLDPSLKVSAKHVTSTVKRGGNKELHKALTSAADRLIRSHSEMFGRWGYNIYLQTGKWKKATNAVARKLSVALYYMMLTGQEFSYDNYNLVKYIDVFDIPVSDLPMLNPDFKRYVCILEDNGIDTTKKMATAYLACELSSIHGLGRKFFATIRDFLDCQHKYIELYKQLHKKEEPKNEP